MNGDLATTGSPKRYRLPSRPGHKVRLRRHKRSPDPDDTSAVRAWLESRPRPWAIDLFCGAGGLSSGIEQAGFSVVAAADEDTLAVESHAHNIEGLTWTGDLSDPTEFIEHLRRWGITSLDLLAGGPPCQPFSLAGVPKIGSLVRQGLRDPEDRRADLWRSFFAIIDHLHPESVMFENVQGFTSAQDGAVLVELVGQLEGRSYEVHTRVLKASEAGVPQHRSRLFVIGVSRGGSFQWPRPVSRKLTTLGDAIQDLPDIGADVREEEQPYFRPDEIPALARSLRRGLRGDERDLIRDHVTRGVRPDDAKIYEHMEPGDTYANVPVELRRYRSDTFSDKYYRLSMDQVSRTITAHLAKDGYWYIHPNQNRTLSVREAARVQTFPDRFRFAGTPSARFRQIGNAVPPLLAKAVAKSVRSALVAASEEFSGLSQPDGPDSSLPNDLRDALASWFGANRRIFAWRTEPLSMWQVLMIEMCLHRTRAEQVAQIADEVLKLGRTPQEFLANLEDLTDALSTLGLQWRVSNLAHAADYLIRRCDGRVPLSRQELMAIPGVADYIASAVLCFGHDVPSVLIDTNTRRIVRRILGEHRQPANWEVRLELHRLAGKAGPDSQWNQALLDLGALVCTALSPKCPECPIRKHCATGIARPIEKRKRTQACSGSR